MKETIILLIFAFIILPAMKMIEYCRFIKLHNQQVEQLEILIDELKAKQKVLNQRLNILQHSEGFQKSSLQNLYANIYKTIDKLIVNDK